MAKKKSVSDLTSTPKTKTPQELLMCYSVSLKKKVQVTKNATITKNKRNALMLKGQDEKGNNLFRIISKADADILMKGGFAEKDF